MTEPHDCPACRDAASPCLLCRPIEELDPYARSIACREAATLVRERAPMPRSWERSDPRRNAYLGSALTWARHEARAVEIAITGRGELGERLADALDRVDAIHDHLIAAQIANAPDDTGPPPTIEERRRGLLERIVAHEALAASLRVELDELLARPTPTPEPTRAPEHVHPPLT